MSKKDKSQLQMEGDLLSLRALIAVVDEAGFSAAAKRIHRAQSAVRLQIAKLEARLNSKLLERSTRSVALTPAGETFISYARRISRTGRRSGAHGDLIGGNHIQNS